MELLKLSKFKLQLRALITEVHHLKDTERSANEQLQLTIQKQKQAEVEFGRKIAELQAELDSSFQLRHKLERKISCLENENELLENQLKGLKETISNLLQSKESFVKAYDDSFGEMKQVIEARDRTIEFLSEKVKAHLLVVEAIQREASSIKNILENADSVLKEREEVVAGLKRKADMISNLEKLFIEKINDLESKLRNNEDELTRKDKLILNLESRLAAGKNCETLQNRVNQEDLSAKEILIENLTCEKKALLFEVGSLGYDMKKVQEAVSRMDEQNRKEISLILEGQDKSVTITEDESNREVQVTGHDQIYSRDNAVDAPGTEDDPIPSSRENAVFAGKSGVAA